MVSICRRHNPCAVPRVVLGKEEGVWAIPSAERLRIPRTVTSLVHLGFVAGNLVNETQGDPPKWILWWAYTTTLLIGIVRVLFLVSTPRHGPPKSLTTSSARCHYKNLIECLEAGWTELQ